MLSAELLLIQQHSLDQQHASAQHNQLKLAFFYFCFFLPLILCEWQVNKTIQLNESEPILAAAEYFNVKEFSFKEAGDGDVPVGFVAMKQLVLKKKLLDLEVSGCSTERKAWERFKVHFNAQFAFKEVSCLLG